MATLDELKQKWFIYAAGLFQENAAGGQGRLVACPCQCFKREYPYRFLMNRIINPYTGPEWS